MPRVPTYTPKEGLELPPVVQVRSPLVDIGASLARTGSQLGEYALRMQEQQEHADAVNMLLQFADEERAYLRSSMTKEGTEARGITDEAGRWYNEKIQEYAEKLSPKAREMFISKAASRRLGGLDTLARHEASEHKQYLLQTAKAMAEQLELVAKETAGDDARFEQEWKQHVESLQSMFPGYNLGAELAKQRQEYIKARIQALMEDYPEQAQQVLEKYKSELEPGRYSQISKALKAASEDAVIDRAYEQILYDFKDNLALAISQIRKPEVYRRYGLKIKEANQIANLLKADYAFQRAQEREAEQDAREASLARWIPVLFADTIDYQSTKQQILADRSVPPAAKEHLLLMLTRRSQGDMKVEDAEAENAALKEITGRIINHEYRDPIEFFKDAESKLRKFSSLSQVANMYFSYPRKESGGLNYFQFAVNRANKTIDAVTEDKAQRDTMKVQFAESLKNEMLKRKLSPYDPQIDEVADALLVPIGKKGLLSFAGIGRTKLAFEEPEQPEKELAAIPPKVRAAIIKKLTEANQVVSPANIIAVYRRMQEESQPEIKNLVRPRGLVTKPMPLAPLEEEPQQNE